MERTLIYYPAGAYGRFVEWCLEYFSSLEDFPMPFTTTNSAHDLPRYDDWNDIENYGLLLPQTYDFALQSKRSVWSLQPGWGLEPQAFKDFQYVIHIHVDESNHQWIANNSLDKVTWKEVEGTEYMQWISNKGMSAYGVNDWNRSRIWLEHYAPEHASNHKWQVREVMSYWDYKDMPDYTMFYQQMQPERCVSISVKELAENFTLTMRRVMRYMNLPVIKNNFDTVHDVWINKQIHQHKDHTLSKIIELNEDFNFELSFIDEIAIQKSLREKGYEIQCDGLNTFPNNMKDLKNIIYQA